jgi:hypothetical protein
MINNEHEPSLGNYAHEEDNVRQEALDQIADGLTNSDSSIGALRGIAKKIKDTLAKPL